MAENRADLRRMIRRKLMSWPKDITALSAAITTMTATIVTVNAVSNMVARDILEVESELMEIQSITGTTLTVMRGVQGSTAATHAISTAVSAYPWYEWSNQEINDSLNLSFDWRDPEVWYGKWYENTALVSQRELGLPSGVRYPDGEIIKKVELKNGDFWIPVYCWRQQNDRLLFDFEMDQQRSIRLYTVGKHARLTDDTTTMYSSEPVDAIINYACKLCLENLLANRTRYVEYSAALNDRASTPDELSRQTYYFYNQAVLAKERASRPFPSGFASTRRSA